MTKEEGHVSTSPFRTSIEDSVATWVVSPGSAAGSAQARQLISKNLPATIDHLHHHGALRVRGLTGVGTANDFSTVVSQVTPALRDYVGGTSPRERVQERIMTATYTPQDSSIILHQEVFQPQGALRD